MSPGFGGSGYTNPQTRALNSIANGGPADTTSQEKMAELLQRHSAQLRYLAANQKQLQKGINEATANPIEQLQQFVADIIVLLGGGELAKGALDFGDLQYILPALGALFGFGDGPFPISLFEAASKFFFGYVVPQEQFVDVINNIITAWAGVFGIDPEFVADVRDLLTAVGNLFGGLGNLLPSLQQLFDALGINGADLGPLGQVLAPIIQLFAGIDLTKFGDFIEFITDAISPVIQQLTAVINFINGVVAVLGYDGGDVVNSPLPALLQPFHNLISFLANINLFGDDFDPAAAVEQFVNAMLLPLNLLLGPNSPLNLANAFGWLPQIDVGSIGQFSPNLLSEGDFLDSIVINPLSGYSVEDGAAVVTANGTDRPLKSEVIRVSPGQQIWAGASAAYESAAGAAGSVLVELVLCVEAPLEVAPSGWSAVSTMILGSLTPSGTSPDWTVLSNELSKYTVPASGVEGVAVQLHVTPDALSGKVKYKSAFIKKTQKLPIPFVGELPETLQAAANRVQAIIDRIINAFENLGEFVDGEHDVEDVLGAIFGIFDVGLGARTKAAAIEARVRQLESEANSIVLDFAGASSTSLSGWTVTSSGGGAGSMGLDGKGNLVWKASGAGNRTQIGRYNGGALAVDNGRLEWILSSSPQSYIFDDGYTYVLFRVKDSANCVRVRSGFDEIRLQAVVGGAVSNIGLAWDGYPKAGDQFSLDFGEPAGANKRHFVLTRNGTPIIDVTDTAAVSPVGPEFNKIGAGMETGNRLVFFQNIPAGLGVLTASEVL